MLYRLKPFLNICLFRVEIEKTVHLTEDVEEADLEIKSKEDTPLETDIDIRKTGEGVGIDIAKEATGVGQGTAADHHSNIGSNALM